MAAMASVHTPIITTTHNAFGIGQTDGLPGLLTPVTLPESCSTRWFYDPQTKGTVWSNQQKDPYWTACQPYSQNGVYTAGVCPSGQEFKEVIKWEADQGNHSTETFYQGNCCSTDFTWSKSSCYSKFDKSVTALFTTKSKDDVVVKTTVIKSRPIAVGAYIMIYWHSSDLSSFPASLAASLRVGMDLPAYPTTNAPSSSSASPSMTSSASPSMTAASQDTPATSAKLAGGAIAGISIGVALFMIFTMTLGYLALVRRWKKRASGEHHPSQNVTPPPANRKPIFSRLRWLGRRREDTSPPAPDMPEMEQGDNVYKHFSGGAWRTELHGGTHSRNPSDGSQPDSRFSYYSGATAVAIPPMELEGSAPSRQEAGPSRQEAIPEERGEA
ncbi:hypothetical protein F4780DRAFT_627916 [Xylariomycetidae sp. FL0641]|nr:hypothetical protein F4780DRAFT_627916 [Xylariomycetidae sp. FL0641]